MKVKAIRDFYDRESEMKLRKAGEEFEAKEPRAVHLETLKLVQRVSIKETPTKATKQNK